MTTDCRIIYVDLDDVLCQAARHFLIVVEREFGKRIAYEQLTNFDVGHSCGLSAEERDELYRIVHRPDELLSMAPVERGDRCSNALGRSRFRYRDRYRTTAGERRRFACAWLAKHQISHSSFTVVDKYSRFRHRRCECNFAGGLGHAPVLLGGGRLAAHGAISR